jgi:hypothetical protein
MLTDLRYFVDVLGLAMLDCRLAGTRAVRG